MKFFEKKKKVNPEEAKKAVRAKTAQDSTPVLDIDGDIVYRRDSHLVSIIRLQPINLSLFSNAERRSKVSSLAAAFNGDNSGWQWFCIGRPVDLSNYLDWIAEKAKFEADWTRKNILKNYITEAANIAASGELTERRFYSIHWTKPGDKAALELRQRMAEVFKSYDSCDLRPTLCKDDELLDVYTLFANMNNAAFERSEISLHASSVYHD